MADADDAHMTRVATASSRLPGTTAQVDPRHSSAHLLFTQVARDGPEGSAVPAAFEALHGTAGS